MRQSDLIYDIGFHNGDDTKVYLKKNYRVLAVEANPILVEDGKRKFAREIADGKLTLLNVGISDKQEMLPFYRNHRLSVWSSFDKELGTRNNTPYDVVDVQCTTTKNLFQQYGVPFLFKVDIEGYDYYCLNDLPQTEPKPLYVSCEATHLDWLTILKQKGYSKFKVINQANYFKSLHPQLDRNWFFCKYLSLDTGIRTKLQKIIPATYLYGSSGPFAEETCGEWKTYDDAYTEYSTLINDRKFKAYNRASWFDFHATF